MPASTPASSPAATTHRTIRPKIPAGRVLRAICVRATLAARPYARKDGRLSAGEPVRVRPATVKIPSLDLPAQARALGAELRDAVATVLDDQQCVLGPHV